MEGEKTGEQLVFKIDMKSTEHFNTKPLISDFDLDDLYPLDKTC